MMEVETVSRKHLVSPWFTQNTSNVTLGGQYSNVKFIFSSAGNRNDNKELKVFFQREITHAIKLPGNQCSR